MCKAWLVLLVLYNVFLIDAVQSTSQNLTRKTRQIQGCTLSGTEKYGTCRKWSECQSAQTAYKSKKIAPIYCQYDRIDPVVCCDLTVQNASSSDNRFANIRKQRSSEKKCIEAYTPKPIKNSVAVAAGGVRAKLGEFTHMAALGWKSAIKGYDFLCGGTLISKDFVLTAAHCCSYKGAAPEVARIGGENLIHSRFDNNIAIAKIFAHPQYRRKQVYHDIALMKLETPSFYKPGCLWQTNDIKHKEVIAIGYGDTSFGGQGSFDLIKVFLNIYPKEECLQYYKPGYRFDRGIDESQFCAGDPKKVQDTCQGDSGGPLMVKVNGVDGIVIPFILGITSFGQGCAGGPPSIYVKVFTYLDWIESIVWPN